MTLTSLSLRHVTSFIVKCKKYTACTQIADFFEPNTVLWVFHTIQPSKLINTLATCSGKHNVAVDHMICSLLLIHGAEPFTYMPMISMWNIFWNFLV